MKLRAYIAALHAALLAILLALSHAHAGSMTLLGAGKPTAGGGLDPATTAWVGAVTTAGGTVSGGRQTVVDTFIKCVKTASLWTTLDRYWLLAGEDAGSAKVDMANLQSFTVVNTPTFTVSQGYDSITAGAGNYINTGYNPAVNGTNFVQNSATFGMYLITNTTSGGFIGGGADAGFANIVELIPIASGFTEYRVNDGLARGNAISNAQASFYQIRTGASVTAQYAYSTVAGVAGLLSSDTTASTALANGTMFILAIGQGSSPAAWGTNNRVAANFFASGWNATQVGNFEACQNAMMTSIGINVH
jgi:hypothetical protein